MKRLHIFWLEIKFAVNEISEKDKICFWGYFPARIGSDLLSKKVKTWRIPEMNIDFFNYSYFPRGCKFSVPQTIISGKKGLPIFWIQTHEMYQGSLLCEFWNNLCPSHSKKEPTTVSYTYSVNVTLISSEEDLTAVQWDRHGEQSKFKQFCCTGISRRGIITSHSNFVTCTTNC